MASKRWRMVSGLLILPAALAGLAGCGQGGGQAASASGSKAKAASVEGITAAMLKGALLTKVNHVTAVTPASSGTYASVSQASVAKRAAAGAQVTPAACTAAATEGFDLAAFAGAPAAGVTFRVGGNVASEVLIASSSKSASSALAGRIPAQCAQYQERVKGKAYTYGLTEQAVTGVGIGAKALNVRAVGAPANNLWSLLYRGTHFVGTVTVTGPNASEKAVQEMGRQAYAFAAKTLS